MNLKNYTTEVPASRSIEYIERLLVEFGASNINKSYENGSCTGISFIVKVDGNNVPFRLPAKVKNVFIWLKKKKPNGQDKNLLAQAERIAWKQQYELLHLQLGMIEMDQMEKMEVFLAYVLNVGENRTYYETLKEGKFKALLSNG